MSAVEGLPGGSGANRSPSLEGERQAELAALYRPLDQDDRPWMVQLGYTWPSEGLEQEQLQHLNNLVTIGKISLGSHPDSTTAAEVYKARDEFIEKLPILKAIHVHGSARLKQDHVISLGAIVGTQRLLYGWGVNVGQTGGNHASLITRPEAALQRWNNLLQHGLDPLKIARQHLNFLALEAESTAATIQAAHNIAKAWGWSSYQEKANRLIEAVPTVLRTGLKKILTLGHISVRLIEPQGPEDTTPSDIQQSLIAELENSVAAYLGYAAEGRKITPLGFNRRARLLRAYSSEELRGYISQHADDPVVKIYLKYFPISEEEAESLPKYRELPRRAVAWASTEKYGPDAYRTNTQASTLRGVLLKVHKISELDQDVQHALLARIAEGLAAESANGASATDEETQSADAEPADTANRTDEEAQSIIELGRDARRQLAASFLAKVADMKSRDYAGTGARYGDYAQERLQADWLKLMMSIINLARSPADTWPDDIWPFLEGEIRRMKHKELYDEYS